MYDTEIGFPGFIIDGTACSGGEGEPLPLSELYEDMVAEAEVRLNARRDRGFDRKMERRVTDARARVTTTGQARIVRVYYHTDQVNIQPTTHTRHLHPMYNT